MIYIFYITLVLLTLGMIFSIIRFVKGPTAGDRTVALDTMTTLMVAGLVVLAAVFDRLIYVDVALIYGVLGFIGVIVIARYLEGAL
ncbi:MAG: monovalent cation/H+ antiporter complex subunit F [Draconibacterium sp.]|nr:monovalent cation/H+ antiporter complex subunit F [Draconibacterium sp.]